MIEVLLVDDHEVVRIGMRHVLNDARGIHVRHECKSGEQAMVYLRAHHVDVVLMDLSMPGQGGMETIRRLLRLKPDQRIVVVSAMTSDVMPARILEMGVMGYLSKGAPAEELIESVRSAHDGQRYLGTDVAQRLAVGLLPGGSATSLDILSQREMQVMMMVAEGQGLHQIAESLCVSPKTVGTYRYRLYEKLNITNDVELTHVAIEHGLAGPGRTSPSE